MYREFFDQADSTHRKQFTTPVIADDSKIHGGFSGSFTIFSPNSSVFQQLPDVDSSVFEPISTTFKGQLEVCPDKGIDVIFNIPAHSAFPALAPNAQSLKGPCKVTLQVHLPQEPAISPAASNGKLLSFLVLS
jgi:hypothetical protein